MMDSHMSVGPSTAAPRVVRVDYMLDLICPWCWIGLRNLRIAMDALQEDETDAVVQIQWHASALIPQIPAEGLPYQQFYEARLGSREAVMARRAQVQAHADTVGLKLAFDAITRFPNSVLACALVNAAQQQLPRDAMCDFVESIYAAYFQQGRDIGQAGVLVRLAQDAGVNASPDHWQSSSPSHAPSAVNGVPHYLFGNRWALTGAVPAGNLLSALRQALHQAPQERGRA